MHVHSSRHKLRAPAWGENCRRHRQHDEECKPDREPHLEDAICRACHGLQRLLSLSQHRIQAVQPQSHSEFHAFAIVSRTKIQHETPQSSKYDGRDSTRLLALMSCTCEIAHHELQPILNGVVQECFVKSRVTQRYAVGFKEKTKERFGIRGAHVRPNGLATFGKSAPFHTAISGALALPDLR